MAEEYFPFDSGPGADSREDRWRRMARVWAPSGVVGTSGDDAYNLTVSGLTATINRRATTGVAEAWVDGFMHRLITANWSVAVPAEASANPRVDRIVLRLDPTANTVALARLAGTAAASPVAPTLTQVENGIWEIPLWRFTVPANSVAPLTGLVDERAWSSPDSGTGRVVAYGWSGSSQGGTTTNTRVLGGLNVTPKLTIGRLYEVEWTLSGTTNGSDLTPTVRALSGATAPAAATGTLVGGGYQTSGTISTVTTVLTGKFTVNTSGSYTVSPFLLAGGATPTSSSIQAPSGGMTLVIRDAGPSAGIVGATPIAVP